MNCDHYEELASRFIDNELDSAGELEMFAHLRGCASCRGFLRTAMQARASLLRDAAPHVPETLDRRINALFGQTSSASHPFRWRELIARRFLIPAPTVAAVILFILLSFGALLAALTVRSGEQSQLASSGNYLLVLPEVEVRGVYHPPSNIIQ